MLDYTKEELDSFVQMYGKIEKRINAIAPKLASYYPSSAYIAGFSILYGKCIIKTERYDTTDCTDPYDRHEFDVKYLAMSDEEIDAEVMKFKEKQRQLREEYERKQYERLRAKYGEKEAGK